ncbi:MAG: SMI1/KNR4 family protein [Dermatophilaceae bacterium]|jgi:hypothetical protein|nr:SMI1/KNR4 family protein [Dermatophilaceae bacterium]
MTELRRLLDQIRQTPGCDLSAPRGRPGLRAGHLLPDDLLEFYVLAGGARLFAQAAYPVRIVGPDDLARANLEIVGTECPDDLSDSWYIVARGGRDQAISIDCAPARLGRCYDSFWDCHGVAGSCRVVARSFTELLRSLVDAGGGYWYWLASGAAAHGDAYGG